MCSTILRKHAESEGWGDGGNFSQKARIVGWAAPGVRAVWGVQCWRSRDHVAVPAGLVDDDVQPDYHRSLSDGAAASLRESWVLLLPESGPWAGWFRGAVFVGASGHTCRSADPVGVRPLYWHSPFGAVRLGVDRDAFGF